MVGCISEQLVASVLSTMNIFLLGRRLHQSRILTSHQLTLPLGHVHTNSMRPLMKVSALHSK